MDLLRSLPLGLYLEQPITWLHHLDPRVKIAWLMSFLIAPVLANPLWRIALAVLLIAITLTAAIPLRVWKQQMGWLLMLCFFVFILSIIAPDGLASDSQRRLPADDVSFGQPATLKPGVVKSASTQNPDAIALVSTQNSSNYRYVLFHQGPVKITRKSLDLAINVSTLLFTLIYSTNLFLLTTAPEEITAGIESLMEPLRAFKIPVTEIALTLTLSLRFIPLVLEEVQNLVRSVRTRAINWKKLGIRKSLQLWLMVAERLLENLLLRADQIASAMKVRGFTSPDRHRVQWHQLRLKKSDWAGLVSLVVLWGARLIWGWEG
ncbi:energy-coupling factor transporter transmembrane component T family protein [Coleofasciculus sp. H7-2]|uniref:energy-coupling factor transporter transmembrane component T family protein n=1 Tax=Coleofasciculus sp. H7-2 TaxID=3351545 RepID=UPI00366FBE4D